MKSVLVDVKEMDLNDIPAICLFGGDRADKELIANFVKLELDKRVCKESHWSIGEDVCFRIYGDNLFCLAFEMYDSEQETINAYYNNPEGLAVLLAVMPKTNGEL